MPVTYTILEDHRAVLARATGALTGQDFLGYLDALAADPRTPVPHVTLLDASGVSHLEMVAEDIEAISASTVAIGPRVRARKLAIVVRGEEQAGLAERYRALASGFQENTLVFFSWDVACAWLGLPADVAYRSAPANATAG